MKHACATGVRMYHMTHAAAVGSGRQLIVISSWLHLCCASARMKLLSVVCAAAVVVVLGTVLRRNMAQKSAGRHAIMQNSPRIQQTATQKGHDQHPSSPHPHVCSLLSLSRSFSLPMLSPDTARGGWLLKQCRTHTCTGHHSRKGWQEG